MESSGRNLLFFGHFADLPEHEYIQHVREILDAEENVYEAMTRDIYQMGKVLHKRKYPLLGWSYRVLVLGVSVSTFLFLVENTVGLHHICNCRYCSPDFNRLCMVSISDSISDEEISQT